MDQLDHTMDQLETDSEEEPGVAVVGQESTTAKKRSRLASAWKIRITGSLLPGGNWEERDKLIKQWVNNEYTKEVGIQREKGKKTGVIHYQGVFILEERKRFETICNEMINKWFPNIEWNGRAGYLQPTKSRKANEYVMKRHTREAGPWFKGTEFEEIAKQTVYTVNIVLRPWQCRIVKIIKYGSDDRSIWWFWEPCGGCGKTTFQKWIFMNFPRVTVLGGKAADMKNGIIEYLENNDKIPPEIILINLPKTFKIDYFSPTGTEEVKDMFFYSGKYKGGMVCDKPPLMFIFANQEPPDVDDMAHDRWKLIRLPDGPGSDGKIHREDWSNIDDTLDEYDELVSPYTGSKCCFT